MLSIRFPTLLILVLLFFALSSCFNSPKKPADNKNVQSSEESPIEGEISPTSMTVSSVDLYHHDPSPTFGEVKKPTLWLHAEKFQIIDENNWKIEDIKAVIYDTRSGEERIRILAESGTFDKMKSASLSGKVHAEMEDISFETESLLWTNKTETEPAKITTGGKVSLKGNDISLTCSSLLIYPEDKTFELTEVSGILPLMLRKT